MSREIKFRAWSKLYKQWCGGTNYIDGVWLGWICRYGKDIMTQNIILEQYTGLKDKNGKEIYEGDIVFCKQCNENYVISWSENAACFDSWQSDGSGCVWFGESHEKFNYMVIGNIHENPELLGGENEQIPS